MSTTTISKSASKVYQEHLGQLGYGIALWTPKPLDGKPAVRIGDVGYIDPDHGSWHGLFNILDPRESQKDVPDNFSPLTTSSLSSKPIRYPNQLQAQIYTSQEITQKDLPADKSSRNEHPDTVTCQYRCEGESGALLALQQGCDSVLVPHNRDWISYMRRNHRSWHDYVTQKCGLTIDKEDVILVRDHIKARN
ncbi:hypothetical protein QCA50_013653 [Cerrena zonata]|uniref:Uncharacterized protein n=1 Tax=Cerrena zonata TaxID=2478898 RepID=A0AAW0FRJ3_9APHY